MHHPTLLDLIGRVDLAQELLLQELAAEGQAVRDSGEDLPTFGFEFDMIDRLTFLVQDQATASEEAEALGEGYGVLGDRAEEIIRWGQAFQKEILSILADPDIPHPRGSASEPGVLDRRVALEHAVNRYRLRPEAALAGVPKDMNVLYGHEYALGFRTGYADLDGFIWAGHWLRLAASAPLADRPPGDSRAEGVDTVSTRYYAKLTYGEPPEFFPSEIPLAPAIAPGLIWLSPEAAMIWDNLSMYLEVLADVLAAPDIPDVPAAIEATTSFFMDPDMGYTDQDEWEIMALRHGIFYQGGHALAVMLRSERNVGGHAAHIQGEDEPVAIPGMPAPIR